MTEACTLIIFGATGNLAQVKLLPALYHPRPPACCHRGPHRVLRPHRIQPGRMGSSMCARPSPSVRAPCRRQTATRFAAACTTTRVTSANPDTFQRLAACCAKPGSPTTTCSMSACHRPPMAVSSSRWTSMACCMKTGLAARRDREALRLQPRAHRTCNARSVVTCAKTRPTVSITTWARPWCRTCWYRVSRT